MTNGSHRPTNAEGEETFGQWLARELTARGYDLRERGGGRRQFAAKADVAPAIVSRALRDVGVPDIKTCGKIAKALGVKTGPVLVRAGHLPADELPTSAAPAAISQRDALAALGVHTEDDRNAVLSLIRALTSRREP
ncbi:helix-turn-helix domain-containing protein [Streptomyces olivaceus]|uniref:helix-turn-helix domain-containing protein n=1 Tax=Streptomyces olivaceus TaxID=47716 RepID=UPI001CCB2D3B|nr:helix-turn-helix transcriptional regulator [Streptomyces olivaceus]MBZ6258166.1 helix-turn-helix domain-containing protein [Streptomyces olivaceus]